MLRVIEIENLESLINKGLMSLQRKEILRYI